MHKSIEKLAYKIAEAVQGDQLIDSSDKINIYHRKVSAHGSANLAYANGVVASGLRAATLFSAEKNAGYQRDELASVWVVKFPLPWFSHHEILRSQRL